MDPQFDLIIQDIKEWIESDEYKDANNITFDKDLNCTIADYIAAYFTDELDMFGDSIINEIPLNVYIKEDKSFKIEMDFAMFSLFYGGYVTPKQIKKFNSFMKYAKKKGYIQGDLVLLK